MKERWGDETLPPNKSADITKNSKSFNWAVWWVNCWEQAAKKGFKVVDDELRFLKKRIKNPAASCRVC